MKIRRYSTLLAAIIAAPAMAQQWQTLPDTPPTPKDNPTTAAKVELGKMLYFDPRFSSTGTVSCNSCHNVMLGGEDNRPVSVGVEGQKGGRSAPTVWNAAYLSVQFWDGREPTLEAQAKGPVINPIEMGMESHEVLVERRLRQITGYKPYFEKAFGPGDVINIDNFAKAIAAYERTLITPDSPYSRYVKGDKKALTPQQIAGMEKFSKAGCGGCHSGGAFAGPEKPLGEGFFMKFPTFTNNEYVSKYNLAEDGGRFEATQKEADKNMWRVPTLLNIALTAPYFHNGSVQTLDEAVRVMAKTQLDKDLSDEDVADIVAFLNSLTGEFPEQTMPRLPATPDAVIADIKK